MVSPIWPTFAATLALLATVAVADEPTAPAKPPVADNPVREIYVPFEDLNVILDNDKHRVFLTREEYEELIKQAQAKPRKPAPHKVVLVATEYEGQLEDGRTLITGQLTIDVLEEGLFVLPLELGGVGIRAATLDGKPAPLSLDKQRQPSLLLQGKGLHKLELRLTAPLQTAAAQQTLQIKLPSTAATRLKLAVPGNVDVKGGAAVVSRSYDMAANRTLLELLTQQGGMAVVMSLNNRLLSEQRIVVARSVIVDEITQGYERIHVTISYRVLHGAVEKLRLAVPAGFEVMKVESVLLARWEEKADADGTKKLEATLRESTSEQIVLHLTANRSPGASADWLGGLADWKLPHLEPLDTAGQVAVIGVVAEDRLRPENITTTGLLPIDSAAVSAALPASVRAAEPGAPAVRQVVSYYAPTGDYSLAASFVRPPAGLKVAANSLLVIGDQGLTLQGGFSLTPEAERLFEFCFVLPAGWKVTQVMAADGAALPVERYPDPAGGTRVLVRLAKGISIGQTQTINYQAVLTPLGWLADWTTQKVEFPKILVEGATSDSGAIAAQTVDDLVVRPETLSGLTPLLDYEKAAFGLGNIPTALAYRFAGRDFAAGLVIERIAPSVAAQVYAFLKFERDNLAVHYELNYDVREARTRLVAFSMPIDTPAELTIRGLESTVVKETSSREVGDQRRWIVQLAERQIGRIRLAIDFTQRLPATSQRNYLLPLIQAEDVEYQSGLVAVEGDAESDVSVSSDADTRAIDIGELTGADYALGRRVIGSFGYVGTQAALRATITRREAYALPPALIQRAELVTKVSAGGRAQSVARYDLLTKATLLEIRLPPKSTLWTVFLDEQPTKPQKEKDSLLLSLPAQERITLRKLQLAYESPLAPLGLSGTIEAASPLLLVRAAGTDTEREIPQADLQWQLILPTGYSVRRALGTVDTDDIPPRELAATKVGRFLYELAGGIRQWYAAGGDRSAVVWNAAVDRADSVSDSTSAAREMVPMTPAPMAEPAQAMPGEAKSAAGAQIQVENELKARLDDRRSQPGRAGGGLVETIDGVAALRAGLGSEDARKKSLWALEGVSSLKIDIPADSGPLTTFHSLGDAPQLEAVVIDQRRIEAAAWGIALLILLVGVGLTRQPARIKAPFVMTVLLASTVPLLLTTALDEVGQVFDYAFFAGCALAVYYPIATAALAAYRWGHSWLPADCCQPSPTIQQIATLLVATTLLALATSSTAQEPPPPESVRIVNLKDLLPLLENDPAPVAIPADAIIVPYDPDKPRDRAAAEKILVPYAKYVELWNQAHPDKRIDVTPPPVGYAIAGTAYEATLTSGDFLSLMGRMEIDVYSDKPVAVPLHLTGGVLERATVDGQPARLQFVEPQSTAVGNALRGVPSGAKERPRILLLHLSDKGRKTIELHVRLGLSRQGGWRIVRGQIPVGPAAALTLRVPESGTEIRQANLTDRPTFEPKLANDTIETTLGSDGRIDLQWRPKVAEGMVDQALTARSTAAFDVREDSLRMTWQVRLEFGRAFRDAFSLTAPADYLVEQVTGDNIRGWTSKPEGERQRIDVTLLKPVQDSETLTVYLAKRGRVGQDELAEFDAPLISVEGAALEQGDIVVRKSPRLDLRTLSAVGLSRADNNQQTAVALQLADAADAAVLVVRPYQVFRYVRPPFRLKLAASELPALASAEVRAALRIAERDTTLDAAVIFRPKGQPLYRVRLYLPDGFALDRLGPAELEWSITAQNNRQLLTVQLLDGRTGEFTLTLLGKIATGNAPPNDPTQLRSLPAPQIEVLDVDKQEGELVVLPDPDTDVRIDNLRNCEAAPLTSAPIWMKAEQQPLAKAVLRYRAADYGATLSLASRTPLVSARTITNVKITPRSVEETVLLNFRIEQAGIRRVVFLVPQHLAKARLKARLLKQKTVEPATTTVGEPIAGMVRMTLELQDHVRGEYGVLLEKDRLLASGRVTAALPVVETGRTDRRLVAIENSGRDEVVIDAQKDVVGLAPVNRQQQAWRDLAAVLGDQITQAYAAVEGAPQPSLSFTTVQRQQAERAGARIALATTLLVVDGSGTYRAFVQYRVTNATEQFLELTLPRGARLWTAAVAGEPVKPAETVPPRAGAVRLPLVKTAEGEGDYSVELKYGGRLPIARGFRSVSFPLIQMTNINIEQSMVRLLLPESRQWFNFQGTMRIVEDEGELAKSYQSYLCERIQEATQALSSSSDYTKVRAAVNLKQSRELLENSRGTSSNNLTQLGLAVHDFSEASAANSALLEKAEQQVQQQLGEQKGDVDDNRGRLNEYFNSQGITRSKNVVSDLASNFDAAPNVGKGIAAEAINPLFFDQNKLRTEAEALGDKNKDESRKLAAPLSREGKESASRFFRGGKPMGGAEAQQAGRDREADQKAPDIAGTKELDMLQRRLQEEHPAEDLARRSGGERSAQLQRYQQNLEMNLAPQSQGQTQQPQAEGGFGIPQGRFGANAPQSGGYGGRANQAAGGAGGGGLQPGGMPGGGFGRQAADSAGQPSGPAMPNGAFPGIATTAAPSPVSGEQIAQIAAGLASLDVQLPERGRVYRFTTPRGDIELQARSVPVVALSRLAGLAAVLVAILVVWLLSREPSLRAAASLLNSTICGVSLVLLGLVSMFSGFLPIAGLLAIVIGLFIALRSRFMQARVTAA